jgi:Ca2+-binding EF-hand superfamily protein
MTLIHGQNRTSCTNWIALFAVAIAAVLNVVGVAPSSAGETNSAGDTQLFDRLDSNHNGVITTEEVTSDNRRLFERLLRRADANHDKSLSREEFLASLVPSRPEKPIEAKQPEMPQADALRYLLLTMDKNQNSVIEADEIPKEMKPAFEFVLDRLDANKNGRLDRYELARGGPALSQIAARYAERKGVDVKAELAKLEKSQGSAFNRFDEQPNFMESLRDPKKAGQLFAQFDQNSDGQLEKKEIPEPLQQPLERFFRLADRDGDGRLSKQEFLDGAERISRFMSRQNKEVKRDLKACKSAGKSGKSQSADKK